MTESLAGVRQMNWALRSAAPAGYRYQRVVGTGGIGSGIVLVLEGSETLRRDESRFGRLLPSRDYCKLHIVFHYIAALLSGGAPNEGALGPDVFRTAHRVNGVQVVPIGKVGGDEAGARLCQMMRQVGMDMRGVTVDPTNPTMFAVCIQYDDGSGGNVTTSTSASSQVLPQDVDRLLGELSNDSQQKIAGDREVIVALPEVPLCTRLHVLEMGRTRGSFNVSSCTSSEMGAFCAAGGIERTDLLVINMDEAGALLGRTLGTDGGNHGDIVEACMTTLTRLQPDIAIAITDGARGSYGMANGHWEYVPSYQTEVIQTGGAGDAYLAGVITALTCGLPFHKGTTDRVFGQTPLTSAMEFGTLLASISLTSPHSLHETIDVRQVHEAAARFEWSLAWAKLFSQNGGDSRV